MNLEEIYRDTQRMQVAIHKLQRRGLHRDEAVERVVGRKPTLRQDFEEYMKGRNLEEKV